jgi:hypothetical protein
MDAFHYPSGPWVRNPDPTPSSTRSSSCSHPSTIRKARSHLATHDPTPTMSRTSFQCFHYDQRHFLHYVVFFCHSSRRRQGYSCIGGDRIGRAVLPNVVLPPMQVIQVVFLPSPSLSSAVDRDTTADISKFACGDHRFGNGSLFACQQRRRNS